MIKKFTLVICFFLLSIVAVSPVFAVTETQANESAEATVCKEATYYKSFTRYPTPVPEYINYEDYVHDEYYGKIYKKGNLIPVPEGPRFYWLGKYTGTVCKL
ncbi:hypothetical protein [Brevibacillus sp. MER 51]|uniref:hypothetical protein n=1 Tax=Brevibacillus sp. MER 51 TaxID=2939560 RepID=UPI00203F9C1B|nr:hypothetical protein [Brevibacillus sp. MER 51]MCM3145361.1 hypothetical protein [Brevibacillus sp. MER 51]